MSNSFQIMTAAEIPGGMRLVEIAGWNQTAADWERFLRASPEGCFFVENRGEVIATVTTIVYGGKLAWIGMVLVDPEHRGQGIGTSLLEKAVEYLDGRAVPTIKLDATPQGKPIYEKLGFVPEYEIERWVLHRPSASLEALKPSLVPDIDRIVELDGDVFGADRGELLHSLHLDAPDFTLAAEMQGEIVGYALGRGGCRADHLGPWMAWDEPTAWELLDEFLRRSARDTVFVDCLKDNPVARSLVRSRGFQFSRPLTRMVRGPNSSPGKPELLCAILGPEFG